MMEVKEIYKIGGAGRPRSLLTQEAGGHALEETVAHGLGETAQGALGMSTDIHQHNINTKF